MGGAQILHAGNEQNFTTAMPVHACVTPGRELHAASHDHYVTSPWQVSKLLLLFILDVMPGPLIYLPALLAKYCHLGTEPCPAKLRPGSRTLASSYS